MILTGLRLFQKIYSKIAEKQLNFHENCWIAEHKLDIIIYLGYLNTLLNNLWEILKYKS